MPLDLKQLKNGDMFFVCGYLRGNHLGAYINLKPEICRIQLKPNLSYSHIIKVYAIVGKKSVVLGEYSTDLSKSTVYRECKTYAITEHLDQSIECYNHKIHQELKRLDEFYDLMKSQIRKSIM